MFRLRYDEKSKQTTRPRNFHPPKPWRRRVFIRRSLGAGGFSSAEALAQAGFHSPKPWRRRVFIRRSLGAGGFSSAEALAQAGFPPHPLTP